jgi:hypothetical protein
MSHLLSNKSYLGAWGLNEEADPYLNDDQIKAFFNLEDVGDDEEVGKWLEEVIPILQSRATDFVRKAIENLMFYKGVQEGQHSHHLNLAEAHRYYKSNRVSINIFYEFVEFWVNSISQYKANIDSVPTNNDTSARDSAEAKKLALQDYIEKNNINELLDEFSRQSFIFGEAYAHSYWDYDKGEIHPEFDKISEKYQGLKRVSTPSGDDVNINRLPRIGDAHTHILPPLYVLFEDKPWNMLDYIILDMKENADKLRSDYPDIEIKGSGEISCYWMYHLPTKYLQKGRFVKYAAGEVLENTEFPYDKPFFPVTRLTDIDVVGAPRGKSFLENIKTHQVLLNETISTVWNNLRRSAKGKWVMQAKTCNLKHLAPESPGIEYYGASAPQFVAYPGIKPEQIQFIELIREYAEKQARIHGVSQGTPPPNVRSGLQFAQLEEQQKKNVEITINKRNNAIEHMCEVLTMIMVKHYKPSDGRMVTIFGKDKEYLTQALQLDALKEGHAIRVKNDDFMPMGRASQLALFTDLHAQFGSAVVPPEMMIDLFDSGRFNEYTEFAGATIETTKSQISDILKGEDPGDVGEYEDLVLKWKILVGTMRKRAYRDYPPEVKESFEAFVLAVETLLMETQQSPITQEMMQGLTGFPIYYEVPTAEYASAEDAAASGMMPPVPPEAAMMAAGGGMPPMPPEAEMMAQEEMAAEMPPLPEELPV